MFESENVKESTLHYAVDSVVLRWGIYTGGRDVFSDQRVVVAQNDDACN